MQLLTQKQSLWKELIPDWEELNEKNKVEEKNIYSNTQNIEKKRNTQHETTNTINLNPSNNTKRELVREDTSNTNSNPYIQQKEHKQFVFVRGHSMVKDIDGYLLTGDFIVKVRPFSLAKTVDMQDYIKPTKRDFGPSLHLLHVGINDLSQEDTPEAISKRIIATAESLKKKHNEVSIWNISNIRIINHSNINPQRHLNWSRLHFNSYGRSIFVKNVRDFMNNLSVSN